MHERLADAFEARRPLLEHVAYSLEQEVREYVAKEISVDRVVFQVATTNGFLEHARLTIGSEPCSDPLVEVENQIVGLLHVRSPADVLLIERLVRNSFSVVKAARRDRAQDTDTSYPHRRLTCVIPPQVKPLGWDVRRDVPEIFEIQIIIVVPDSNTAGIAENVPTLSHESADVLYSSRNKDAGRGMPEPVLLETNNPRLTVENEPEFDVFLAHSSEDKGIVAELAAELSKFGLRPWLDSDQIRPGQLFQDSIQRAIQKSRSIAICIGPGGLGKWQALELKTSVSHCINNGIPVIPVLLPSVETIPATLPFLSEFNWVRFFTRVAEQENISRLVWGITGKRPMPNDVGEAADGLARKHTTAAPVHDYESLEAGRPGRSGRVLFALHGIRTYANWNRSLYEIASEDAWQVRTERWYFGYFSVFQLLMPWARSAKVIWFRATYWSETHDKSVLLDKGQYPSIVAHSFGTYILGNALLKYDWLRFNKVILCGSILPVDFPWDKLIERGQVQSVRNEHGILDVWSRIVHWFVAGAGPSGQIGFRCRHERLEQESFEYTHSEYFDRGHMEAKWLPFLSQNVYQIPITSAPVQRPIANRPWAAYLAYALNLFVVLLFVWKVAALDLPLWGQNGHTTDAHSEATIQEFDMEIAARLGKFERALTDARGQTWESPPSYLNVLWLLDTVQGRNSKFREYSFVQLLQQLHEKLQPKEKHLVQGALTKARELERYREKVEKDDPNQTKNPHPFHGELEATILPGLRLNRWIQSAAYIESVGNANAGAVEAYVTCRLYDEKTHDPIDKDFTVVSKHGISTPCGVRHGFKVQASFLNPIEDVQIRCEGYKLAPKLDSKVIDVRDEREADLPVRRFCLERDGLNYVESITPELPAWPNGDELRQIESIHSPLNRPVIVYVKNNSDYHPDLLFFPFRDTDLTPNPKRRKPITILGGELKEKTSEMLRNTNLGIDTEKLGFEVYISFFGRKAERISGEKGVLYFNAPFQLINILGDSPPYAEVIPRGVDPQNSPSPNY